jgi:hypothetical protein
MAGLGIASEDDDGVGAGLEPEFISQKEIIFLKDYAKNTGTNLQKYFELLGCKSFESIPKSQYEKALNMLKQKEQSLKSKSNG